MSSSLSKLFFLIPLCAAITACGPEWEPVKVTDIVPYGNSRTAGSGVMYVRANMLKEKDVNLEAQSPSIEETREILEKIPQDRGDKVFMNNQKSKK